ncbi:hypothetical protein DBR06_SOUSAS17510019, partial [Sousa chinensis]
TKKMLLHSENTQAKRERQKLQQKYRILAALKEKNQFFM